MYRYARGISRCGEVRFFTTPRHLGERASRHPPNTHHPPTHLPTTAVQQQCSSTDQSPTAAQQCSSTQHSSAPGTLAITQREVLANDLVREELSGGFHFLTILRLRGERASRPRERLFTLPAPRVGNRRPLCCRGQGGLMCRAGEAWACGRWGPGGGR